MNKKSYKTISEAAEILNISADTIRRWEKKGLIKSLRSTNNYRLFSFEELSRLQNKYNGDHSESKYRILKSSKPSQYTTIELFAGAGGTALGMENSGLNHILVNEIDKDAIETLKTNKNDWNIIHKDVREVNFKKYKGADIVQGGFPCQAFSYAGNQNGFNDARGTMFFELARCIKETKPKIAIAENVRGLIKHDNGKTLSVIVSVLRELGYQVAYKLLRAQYLDVPQKRERLIIMAIRKDLDLPFIFPKERDYTISLREALKDCPKSGGQTYSQLKKKILGLVPEGGYWRDLPIKYQKEYMQGSFHLSGGKTGMARRLSWNEPSLTLTCSPAQKQTERCHPSETRPLTIREYARLQTFPDDWNFIGSVTSQYKQIGNAVPVNLAYHIGRCLIKILERDKPSKDMEYVNHCDFNKIEQMSLF